MELDIISYVLGSASIFLWLFLYIPQIVENYRDKEADGLSLGFLLLWTLSSFWLLFATIHNPVLLTLRILAVYHTVCICILLGQYLYYQHKAVPWQVKGTAVLVLCTAPFALGTDVGAQVALWSSVATSLGGRLFQIYKNWKTRDVKHVSMHMFALMVVAGVCNMASILVNYSDMYFAMVMNGFCGLLLDCISFLQCILYRGYTMLENVWEENSYCHTTLQVQSA